MLLNPSKYFRVSTENVDLVLSSNNYVERDFYNFENIEISKKFVVFDIKETVASPNLMIASTIIKVRVISGFPP